MDDIIDIKKFFKIFGILLTGLFLIFIIYALKLGIFEDKLVLVRYIEKFGVFAFLFFIFLQAAQVVVPIVPGGLSCLVGVMAFGPVLGFVYNYIGLIIGSIISFSLSRNYGVKLIKTIFGEKIYLKYSKYIKNNTFNKIFFWGIFIPGLPDDLLCYVAGVSNMKFKTFLISILVGKPLSLLGYSLFMHLF